MSTSGWHQMAEWWDEKIGDEGDLWHRTLIDPPLIRLVDKVEGLQLLDLACGNGYLSRRFARQGAIVTGVDTNAPIIERARRREEQEQLGITYYVMDAAHLNMLAVDSLDLVICNMALMDIENAAGAIQEVARVLRKQGRVRLLSRKLTIVRSPGISASFVIPVWLLPVLRNQNQRKNSSQVHRKEPGLPKSHSTVSSKPGRSGGD